MDASALYTQPEDVDYAYTVLCKISPRFTIAASFGNVHGVYKPGNVVLTPTILGDSQEYVSKKHPAATAWTSYSTVVPVPLLRKSTTPYATA
ncbi:class II fructose-bisphosphate aldolase [Escherichia coli]